MSEIRRRFFDLRLRTLVWLIALALGGWTAFTFWSDYSNRSALQKRELLSPSAGDVCTVILRADAQGLKISPAKPTEVDGTANYVRGRFAAMNDQWVQLDGLSEGAPQQWIPRGNVLVIQVESK